MDGVETILKEKRFQFKTPQATAAYQIASSLSKSKSSHILLINKFVTYLTKELKKCFVTTKRTKRLKQAKMWGAYHKLRTSEEFKQEWRIFLEKSAEQNACAAFVQHVTHELFRNLIKLEQPISADTGDTNETPVPMSYVEKNALRYVAGYVCRKLHDRLHSPKCNASGKDEMVISLTDMNGSNKSGDGEDWLNMINRGGLWHINDDVFELFVIMEDFIRSESRTVKTLTGERKLRIIDDLMHNEDLLFQWCFCATDLIGDTSTVLLKQVVELFLTVREFSFASSCLEKYKQSQKKLLSKKKSLRTELNTEQ